MKLLLVRHAQSEGNATGNYSVATHDSLSALGKQQARSLSECLQKLHFDKVIVSPLQRALETLAPYLEASHQRAEIWPEIAEGCWQPPAKEPRDSWRTQPASLPTSMNDLFYFRDGKEIKPVDKTFEEGVLRAQSTHRLLGELALNYPEGQFLMLTHGHFLRELINGLLDTRSIVSFAHDNCGMTLFSFDGVWNMDFCNRPSHPESHRMESILTASDGAPDPRRVYAEE
ncbi:histidine phosphatase family protein [Kiritimatiellaeota bacterium B1221]|nr:histidine phosphatase family protein [Kiritimatiellaeota bacterium B1221]